MTSASKSKARDKANSAVESARPYVKRLIEDEELRENLREAYDAGHHAYARASGAKKPSALLEDKKLQSHLREASESLRAVSEALREPEKVSKGGGHTFTKLLVIAFVGAILAIALSEDLRKSILDQLFGAEEEFEYSSTTSPPAPTA
jgi:hypothetical protein